MERLILIKYGELTTKKENRKMFIKMLVKNINNLISDYEYEIDYDRVRMYINCDNKYIDEIAKKLSKIFGIHSIVICHKVDNNIDNIKSKILEIVSHESFNTFKVETKRADKTFEIHSQEFNHVIGGLILKNFDCKVDVHNPDMLLHIEIRPEGTFIYTNELKGSGGYPVGIQGKGMLMLSGGIDSPVAGYLALKRGIDIDCLYFESPPHTSLEAKNKVIKLASIINEYSGNVKVHVVPFTEIQEAIYKNCPKEYMITIMRRMMYRICESLAYRVNAKCIVNGESVGQVASQTLTSMMAINEVIKMPVIRPVACFDKLDIIDISKKINTYDISIRPFEDCCTIFVPEHPVINPDINKARECEKLFDYETLIKEALKNEEIIKLPIVNNNFTDIL